MTIWSQIRHFWQKDPNKVPPGLVCAVDQICNIIKAPLIIHEACVTSDHADHSYHYTGQAVDFHFVDRGQTFWEELLTILSVSEIRGIGFYPEWIPRPGWHIDIRLELPKVFWIRINDEYHYGIQKFVEEIQLAEGK